MIDIFDECAVSVGSPLLCWNNDLKTSLFIVSVMGLRAHSACNLCLHSSAL